MYVLLVLYSKPIVSPPSRDGHVEPFEWPAVLLVSMTSVATEVFRSITDG